MGQVHMNSLIPSITQWVSSHDHLHFTDGETEALGGQVPSSKPHGWSAKELGTKTQQSASRAELQITWP